MNDTQDILFSKEDFNAEFFTLGRQKAEIDFDHIQVEKEYFHNNCPFIEKSAKCFIGENEESTEINSILTPLNSSASGIFRGSQINEENTDTEEILAILKRKSDPTMMPHSYSRVFSKSTPLFLEAKKIPLKGRVIECASGDIKNEVGFPGTVSNFSLPVHSPMPVRPKCIPRRSITDHSGLRYLTNKDITNDRLGSKFEKKFEL